MLKFLLISVFVLCVSGCSVIRSTKLLTPNWSGFSEISDSVYVDNQMSLSQRQEFLKTLDLAKRRVSTFFGGIEGTPEVFACSTEECFISYGGFGLQKGKAYGASMLLLSPRGLDVVIASHELTHIELHHRIGVLKSWYEIPSWFDEGLAVLVSEDPRYTEEAWLKATDNGRNVPALEEIGKMIGHGDWQLSYGTARRTVGKWYAHVGQSGLVRLISEVKDDKDFNAVLSFDVNQENFLTTN